ncbi:pentatricopeptide repeat-containing protein At3g29230-like [Malania oleifera]|uniref:pentatricopeptide repeat-containing protein At3g29230-like n=1 Tax=Malania oleifera TaxID=397392 RepID=UPI0025ADDED4|nr:pentatricopeptide repeat-containing protein At3g29230-like [Malania oleifera]
MHCSLETISNILRQCTFKQLKQIHAFILCTSLHQHKTISLKLLRRSTEFGTMEYPNLVFAQMGGLLCTDTSLWNAMLRGFAFNGPVGKCLLLYDEMRQRGLKPNNYTYPYVINSCSEIGCFRIGEKVQCQIVKSGFESGLSVGTSLFNMYIKMLDSFEQGTVTSAKLDEARKIFDCMCIKPIELWNQMISQYGSLGNVKCARKLFEVMPERDVVSWNSMISSYVKVGDVANARDLFEQMPEKSVVSWTSMIGAYASSGDLYMAREFFERMPSRNVVSWNSIISGYSQQGKFAEALNLFIQMQSQGVIADGFTYVSVLSACSQSGALEFGKWVHYLIKDWSQMGVVIVGTSLIEMYANCGDVDKAFTIFIKIEMKDVFCWNVMIRSLAIHGRTEDALKNFFLMPKMGLKPNDYTFSNALFACSHGGMVENGRKIFDSMERDFGVSPKLKHFGCFIDLLSRNDHLEEAELLVKEMPFEPDSAIWGALLGGCRVRSDFKLAKELIEMAEGMKARDSGLYVLLSNIYASRDQWPEAASAREKMEEKKIWKRAGLSSVIHVHDEDSGLAKNSAIPSEVAIELQNR